MNENMLELMKKKMIETLQNITFQNYDQTKNHLEEQFKTMDSLNSLNKYEQAHLPKDTPKPVITTQNENNSPSEKTATVKTTETPQPDKLKTFLHPDNLQPVNNESNQQEAPKTINEKDSKNDSSIEKSYTFERMLRGGILPEIEAFVPEGIVKSLEIEHGDLVRARKIENTLKKYKYSVAERRNEPKPEGREQVNLCRVERDGDLFCVTTSLETGELIRIDDAPYKIVLSDKDVLNYSLYEDDIVDVAFYKDKANDAKVIWRHSSTSLPIVDTTPKSESAKKKTTKLAEPIEHVEPERPLDGLNVCIVGESHKKSLYEYTIKQAGGELFMTDGKNKNMQIRSQVKRSDIVVCLVGNTSHIGMETAKDQAKESGVPFLPQWSLSASTIVKSIAQHMEDVKVK